MTETPQLYWKGKAAVVTGGARGQGAAMALQLLAAGASVHVMDTLPPEDAAWDTLRSGAEGRLTILPRSVTEPQAWDELAGSIRVAGLPLHALVNNAGITGPRNTVTRTLLADWEDVLSVNVTGAMLGIRALGPLMASGGAIVNISSTVGMTGYYSAAYSTTKWALRGLTRSAAIELASRGIRVNCVCPGVVDTEMIRTNATLVQALRHVIPVQHMAQPGQIADVVMFLLGPQSSYITGADLPVDGGITGGGIYWPVGVAVGALEAASPMET